MNSNDVRAVIDQYIDAYNRKDIPAMLCTVHPDVEFKNISGGVVNASSVGIAELKALAEQSVSLFSERRQTILSFENTGVTSVVAIGFHAVVANDLPNGLKQGQVLALSGSSEFEFQDGLISKITDIS